MIQKDINWRPLNEKEKEWYDAEKTRDTIQLYFTTTFVCLVNAHLI